MVSYAALFALAACGRPRAQVPPNFVPERHASAHVAAPTDAPAPLDARTDVPRDVPTAHPRAAADAGRPMLESLAFSHDGRWLAAGMNAQIAVIDPATAREVRRIHGSTGRVQVGFLPDGRLVSMGWSDTESTVWDPATGARLHAQQGAIACASFFTTAWSCADASRGYRVSYVTSVSPRRVSLERWDGAALAPVVTAEDRAMYGADALLVTNDGLFAVGGRGGYSTTETEPMHVHRDGPHGATGLFIEQVPRYVNGGYVRAWYRNGARACEWMGVGTAIRSIGVARSAGGAVVAGDDSGAVFALGMPGCAPPRTIGSHAYAVVAVAVHPFGSTAVSGDASGRVVFWDVASGTARGEVTLAP